MTNLLKLPVNEDDHHLHSLNAPVILLEYGDYECPYCAVAAPVIQQLLKEFKDDLCFAYRHFPLKGIHPMAEMAALASEAADNQNLFWEMHEILFINQEDLSVETIEMMARELGLDIKQFKRDVERFDLLDKINANYKEGIQSGVGSTPTLFINGVLYESSTSYWPLREAIELQLRNNSSSAFL